MSRAQAMLTESGRVNEDMLSTLKTWRRLCAPEHQATLAALLKGEGSRSKPKAAPSKGSQKSKASDAVAAALAMFHG